jgi:predicted GNAT family acetyltransferase
MSTSTESEATESEVQVSDNPEQSRYDASLEGSPVGFAEYRLDGETIVFTHTEVDDAAEGKGVGSTLAKAVLDDARRRDLRVVPRCRFIAAYIGRHDEYLDLVDEGNRGLVTRATE